MVNNESTRFEFTQRELSATNDELLQRFQHFFITEGKKTATYKFALLKSILDNLVNVDIKVNKENRVVISFEALASKFAESYWNIVAIHHLKQGNMANGKTVAIEQGIYKIISELNVESDIPRFENLNIIYKKKLEAYTKNNCFKYVLGALCGDFEGLLYEFDKPKKYFALSLRAYKFLWNHKTFIEECNYYCWAKYLENCNPSENTESILTKLETSVPERTSLGIYKRLFAYYNYNICFYCGKLLKRDEESYDVDHFIPWSFIKEDKLWNLVPSCKTCNQKIKRAFLAPYDKLEVIVNRNDHLITAIDRDLDLNAQNRGLIIKAKNDFYSYRDGLLKDLYGYAQKCGYQSFDKKL